MSKYDQHGFITVEWASSNIDGFASLNPCCQNLVMLFPDVKHNCADVLAPLAVTSKIPLAPVSDSTEFYGGAVGGPSLWGPAAMAGLFLLPGDGGSSYAPAPPASVPGPAPLGLLLLGLAVVAFLRKKERKQ